MCVFSLSKMCTRGNVIFLSSSARIVYAVRSCGQFCFIFWLDGNNITSGGRRLLFYYIRSVRFYALKHIGAILVRCVSNKSLRPASFLRCQRDTARTCCGAPLLLNAPAAGMRSICRCDKLGYMGKTLFRYFDHVSGSRWCVFRTILSNRSHVLYTYLYLSERPETAYSLGLRTRNHNKFLIQKTSDLGIDTLWLDPSIKNL